MLQLRCTGKVIKTLGLKTNDLSEITESDTILGNWYINEFSLDRRKWFIFMNENSLLSFVIFGIKKSNLVSFPEPFIKGFDQLLCLEGFDAQSLVKALTGYDEIQYTKTASKSVLGNLNNITNMYKHIIRMKGGLQHTDIGEVIFRVNRMPQRNLDWKCSIEVVNELLEGNLPPIKILI